jgi:arylsulfate sulfotransferase
MQVTIKLKGVLKVTVFFVAVVPCVLYLLYHALIYAKHEAIVYIKTNKVFHHQFTTTNTSQKGYLLLTPNLPFSLQYGKLIIMDMQGHILLDKQVDGVASDFRQWKINGHTRYSYQVYDPNAYQVLADFGAARHVVVLDSALDEIKQIHLLPFNDIITDKKQDLDHHDFILLSDDHYLTMAVYVKTVTNIPAYLTQSPKNKTAVPIIQEVNNGKVVWQWDGSRFPEFYLNSELGNKFYDTSSAQDYTHINSMFIDPRDSNLIVSVHNTNQVIKIDRHTGDILWRLGGRNSDFPLTHQQVFLRQHHATLVDSNRTLLLLDNGEKSARPYSRVLEFNLDEQKKTITGFKAYNIPEPFAGTRGSVQKIGDNYLICGGSANYILEANSRTGEKIMEIKTNQPLYRAYYVTDITGINLNRKPKK